MVSEVLRADHVPILYESAFTGERSWKWRFRGRTVPYETFAAMLHEGVFAQYAVESTVGPPSLLGLVSAYDADTACGHCYVAFHNTGVHHPASGRMFGAIIGFMDHLFHVSPFRKLYLDIPEYNVGLLRGFEGLLMVEEGRLREHYFLGGCWEPGHAPCKLSSCPFAFHFGSPRPHPAPSGRQWG